MECKPNICKLAAQIEQSPNPELALAALSQMGAGRREAYRELEDAYLGLSPGLQPLLLEYIKALAYDAQHPGENTAGQVQARQLQQPPHSPDTLSPYGGENI